MSAKLLAGNHVTALAPSKAELDNLRSIVARSLRDETAAGLSADAWFTMPTMLPGRYRCSSCGCRGLLKTERQFAVDAEAWIKAHDPHLA